jgi:hypothetical protein
MFAAIPLLALPVLIYNAIVLTLPGGFTSIDAATRMDQQLFAVTMTSHIDWSVGLGDLLLAAALVVLFIELLKSTTSRRIAIVNHALSVLGFVYRLPGGVPAGPGLRHLDLLPAEPDDAARRAGRLHRHHRRGPPRRRLLGRQSLI